MSEVTIYDFMVDCTAHESPSKFQKDLIEFCSEHQFYKCDVDEDGELIMKAINPYRIVEFVNGSATRLEWEDLQNRYDAGER
jgi:hypothetical protein